MKCIIDRNKLRNNNLNSTMPVKDCPTHFYSEGKTDLEAIKKYAMDMLDEPVMRAKSGIVNHPFVPTIAKDNEFDKHLTLARKTISGAITPGEIYGVVTPMHLPLFFRMTCDHLSVEDYSKCLAMMWILMEFPNTNVFVGVQDFIELFKDADKTFLMDEDELEIYNNLPEEIVVYRGINEHGSEKALSWTLDKEQAEWFANRFSMFGKTGTVYQANIKKEYVLAYFSREQEAVIDFTKATDMQKIG